MNRFVLDQELAQRAAIVLRQHGLDAVHASELGMSQVDDVKILEWVRQDNRMCVTLDDDFHAHSAVRLQGWPSVVLLRVTGLTAEAQVDLILAVYAQCKEALAEGAAVSADLRRIRI